MIYDPVQEMPDLTIQEEDSTAEQLFSIYEILGRRGLEWEEEKALPTTDIVN